VGFSQETSRQSWPKANALDGCYAEIKVREKMKGRATGSGLGAPRPIQAPTARSKASRWNYPDRQYSWRIAFSSSRSHHLCSSPSTESRPPYFFCQLPVHFARFTGLHQGHPARPFRSSSGSALNRVCDLCCCKFSSVLMCFQFRYLTRSVVTGKYTQIQKKSPLISISI